jgi:hypothetical protein
VTHENNGQTGPDLPRTADLLRRERPKASPLRLDEIKRDVMRRATRTRQPRLVTSLRRRLMALTLFVLLFGMSTSNAAASFLNWMSGGSLGSNTLGYGKQSSGMQFFFGSFGVGGHSSDDAGHETYCPDDKGSDDHDGSSSDDSDGDKSSYSKSSGKSGGGGDWSDDSDKSSGDQSSGHEDECESDKSSDKSSEKSSDDDDKSSHDDSDGDKDKSDDGDKSSHDNSDGDGKSDDGDKSSDDKSDWSDDGDKSSEDGSD